MEVNDNQPNDTLNNDTQRTDIQSLLCKVLQLCP